MVKLQSSLTQIHPAKLHFLDSTHNQQIRQHKLQLASKELAYQTVVVPPRQLLHHLQTYL
ncbi:hypothetical protein [Spartinivicinus ruber]|uniref:hypothetical protein n=1 Tax=Spartinivicinus ruber TaxID=2683272 RepID=UPI0013D0DFE5|nr:hypothetical protein [Spartinivicinus ruber]